MKRSLNPSLIKIKRQLQSWASPAGWNIRSFRRVQRLKTKTVSAFPVGADRKRAPAARPLGGAVGAGTDPGPSEDRVELPARANFYQSGWICFKIKNKRASKRRRAHGSVHERPCSCSCSAGPWFQEEPRGPSAGAINNSGCGSSRFPRGDGSLFSRALHWCARGRLEIPSENAQSNVNTREHAIKSLSSKPKVNLRLDKGGNQF